LIEPSRGLKVEEVAAEEVAVEKEVMEVVVEGQKVHQQHCHFNQMP
jgi:hypothetical protein